MSAGNAGPLLILLLLLAGWIGWAAWKRSRPRFHYRTREDGSVHVSSPDVPLLHLVGRDRADAEAKLRAIWPEWRRMNRRSEKP